MKRILLGMKVSGHEPASFVRMGLQLRDQFIPDPDLVLTSHQCSCTRIASTMNSRIDNALMPTKTGSVKLEFSLQITSPLIRAFSRKENFMQIVLLPKEDTPYSLEHDDPSDHPTVKPGQAF